MSANPLDAVADLLFPGNPPTGPELNRLFAHRGGFRWGVTIGGLTGLLVGLWLAS